MSPQPSSVLSRAGPLHYEEVFVKQPEKSTIRREGVTQIPDCLRELLDYKKSSDYTMFKQLHMQLHSKTSRL